MNGIKWKNDWDNKWDVPSGIQTWHTKIPYTCRFIAGKIVYKWVINTLVIIAIMAVHAFIRLYIGD
jgi:hypothetical protein